MLGTTRQVAVFAFGEPVDMRKSFDSLAALVEQRMQRLPLSGDMFVFVGRKRKRAKVLFWDGTGLCIYAKRLEQGRFFAPWQSSVALRLTISELALFLEGSRLEGRLPLSPSPYELGG